jgi:DNA-binding NarL/FixJ family response regulator
MEKTGLPDEIGGTMVGERESKGLLLLAVSAEELRWYWSQGLRLRYAFREVADRHDLDHLMATLQPAVLLLDLALCQPVGTGEIPAIQRLSPSTKILALTHDPDEKEAIAALKAGARGYCRRDVSHTILRKAVEMIQEGQVWVEGTIIPHLLEELTSLEEQRLQASSPPPGDPLARLTHRERDVVNLIAGGASNREIAAQLHVSEATVKAHLTATFRKLGVSDRLQLGLYVTRRLNGSFARAQLVGQG